MSEPLRLDAQTDPARAEARRRRRSPRAPELPSPEEADRRLAALAAAPPPPWLTSEALEAVKDLPEVCGPVDWPPVSDRP